MVTERTIRDARITVFWGRATLHVTLDDEEQVLFSWYVDELFFTTSDFIGLTVAEANKLRHDRDVAYLRS